MKMLLQSICCVSCNKEIQSKIFGQSFWPTLFIIVAAFLVVALIIAFLHFLLNKRFILSTEDYPNNKFLNPVPFSTASTIMGVGLGGFLDGILLHQILQWHEMISNKLPPNTYVDKSVNMFWDGVFHFFSLIVVFIGLIYLWRLFHRKNLNYSGKILTGGLLAGWGLFNIVEGSVDHHLLKLHNVREISATYRYVEL